ncbi:hypothetical protein ACLOJK_031204 [Asimina triloba]
MAAAHKLSLLLAFTCFSLAVVKANARQAPFGIGASHTHMHQDLLARLDTAGTGSGSSYSDCFSALLELRSCTSEIVLFFLNGQTYLGPDCCHAIHIIARQCWPSMLTSIGFTVEEGQVLLGYCDASSAATPPSPQIQSPLGPAPAAGPSTSSLQSQGPNA